MNFAINSLLTLSNLNALWPTAAVIPVFITGCPVITRWSDYNTFEIPTIAENLLEQLWES